MDSIVIVGQLFIRGLGSTVFALPMLITSCDPGNYSTQSACVADGKRHAESPSEYVRKMSWTTCKELSRKTCVMPAC